MKYDGVVISKLEEIMNFDKRNYEMEQIKYMNKIEYFFFCSHDSCFIYFKYIKINLKIQITCLIFT